MSKLQALREKRRTQAQAILQQRDKLNADGYNATAEDEGNWKQVNDDYNATLKAIEREEIADRIAKESIDADESRRVPPLLGGERARGGDGASEINDEMRTLALAGWLNVNSESGPSAAQRQAAQTIGFNLQSPGLRIGLHGTEDYRRLQQRYRQVHSDQAKDRCMDFKATLTQGSGPGGGYLIAPETLRQSLEVNMLYYGGMRQVAETIRTTSGEPMSWPTADDTTNTGVQLGESTTVGSSVDPTFGKALWSAYKFSSKVVLVPYELIQDSQFGLAAILGEMLGIRLGRITNTKFTTGSGAATCKGIVTAASSFSAASATAIAGDDIWGLIHSVDPAYRNGAGFMMHDSIILALRKLKDGVGNYLWQTGMRDGVPDRLGGYGLTTNQDLDSTVASGKKSILFGQLSKYKIRTVGEIRMYRLQERYRDLDQDAFVAFSREDGNLLTAGTAPVKYLSH